MATLGLDDDELKAVEQTLARLAQLSSSIQSLKMDILKSNPLPHPYVSLSCCPHAKAYLGNSNSHFYLVPHYKPRLRSSSATSKQY
jgi:hypothetical protein